MNLKLIIFIIFIVWFINNENTEDFKTNIYNEDDNDFDLANEIRFVNNLGVKLASVEFGDEYYINKRQINSIFSDYNTINIIIPKYMKNVKLELYYKLNKSIKNITLTTNINTINKIHEGHILSKIKISKTVDENDYSYDKKYLPNNEFVIIKDLRGSILYSTPGYIDWDFVYSMYGYDNYLVQYPNGFERVFHYYYHPNYSRYRPSSYYKNYYYYKNYKKN